MSTERMNMNNVKGEYYQPLIDLNAMLRESTLKTAELLLIYIRASQINGCAYCIQSHIKEAVEKEEKQYRIHALAAWEHSPFFTEEEQVILKMTEEITSISTNGLLDKTYEKAKAIFSTLKIADIIMAVTCINAWNRIGVATLLIPNKSQD